MNEDLRSAKQTEIEARVIRALERRPKVAVPESFAARIAQSLPAKGPSRAMRPVFARAAGYVAIVATMVVLLVLTRMHPEALEQGRGFLFLVDVFLVGQLLAVGLWLGTKSDSFR